MCKKLSNVVNIVCSSNKMKVGGVASRTCSKTSDTSCVGDTCVDNCGNFCMANQQTNPPGAKGPTQKVELPHQLRDLYKRSITSPDAEKAGEVHPAL